MVASGESLVKDMNQVSSVGSTPQAPSTLIAPQINEEPKKKGAFQITNVRQGLEARDTSFGFGDGDTTLNEEDDEDDEGANEEEATGQERGELGIQSSDMAAHGGQNELADAESKQQRFRVVKLPTNLVNDERGRWRCRDAGVDVPERNSGNGSPSAESNPATAEQSPVTVRKSEQQTTSPPIAISTPAASGTIVPRGPGGESQARHLDEGSTGSDVFEPRSLSRQVSIEGSRDSGADSPVLEGNVDASQFLHRSVRSTHEVSALNDQVSNGSRLHPVCREPGQPISSMMGQVRDLVSTFVSTQTVQLEDRNKQLDYEIEQLRLRVKMLEDDKKLLQEENSSLQESRTSLRLENTSLQDKNSSLQQELGSIKGREPVQ